MAQDYVLECAAYRQIEPHNLMATKIFIEKDMNESDKEKSKVYKKKTKNIRQMIRAQKGEKKLETFLRLAEP